MAHMFTDDLPPNTALSLSSSLIIRLFFLSCRPFFLMYAHSFLVTSVRGIAFAPTTSASVPLGCTGRMKAAFGFLFALAMRSVSSQRRSSVARGYHEIPFEDRLRARQVR